ncbi:MAG: helix-turn-helix domain-containing protein [Candidatus Saccharibacteria bacterium]
MENYKDCGLTETIKIIGSKWTLPILYNLLNGKKRFSELQSELGVSPRTLSMRLDQLEKDNIILRKVYPVVPPKVEYSLTARGRSLNNLIQSMADWGKLH